MCLYMHDIGSVNPQGKKHVAFEVSFLKHTINSSDLEKRVKVKSLRPLIVLDASYILVQPIWLQLLKLSSGSNLKFTSDIMGK